MKFALRASALSAVLAAGAVGCGSSASPAATPTPTSGAPAPTVAPIVSSPVPARRFVAGLVTDVGRLGDRSFNDLAWAGIKTAEYRYGIRGEVLQSNTDAAYVHNLTTLARKRDSIVIAVGASMGQAVYAVAARFPKQRFAIVDARPMKTPGQEIPIINVADVLFNEQDAGYAAGTLAGLLARERVGAARHNTIGYLGGNPIPQVDRYLAGYVAGARRVDPGVKVIGQYSHTFTDPGQGRTIGLSQIAKGADILFQVASDTGAGYLQAAGEKHVYAIGVDANQAYVGPQVVASAVKRVDVAIQKLVHADLQGRFLPGDNVFGAFNGGTGLTGISSVVPKSIVRTVARYEAQIAHGSIVPPTTVSPR